MVEVELIMFLIGTNTYAYPGLVNAGKKCPQEPVPNGKNGAVIGIPLLDDNRMVYPVHGGRHKKNPPYGFKPFGDLQAAVVKLSTEHNGAFKYRHTQEARTQKKYD